MKEDSSLPKTAGPQVQDGATKPVLKGCPWCGAEPQVMTTWTGVHLRCANVNCEATVESPRCDTEAEAISIWNRRSGEEHLSPLRDRIAVLEEALRKIESKCADTKPKKRNAYIWSVARAALSNQGRL